MNSLVMSLVLMPHIRRISTRVLLQFSPRVNNHNQTVFFATALVFDETKQTFCACNEREVTGINNNGRGLSDEECNKDSFSFCASDYMSGI